MDDHGFVAHVLDEMQEQEREDVSSTYVFLLDFMEYLIKDDVLFLQEYEEKLTKLEESLLNGHGESFDRQILAVRKDLAALGTYYQQLLMWERHFREMLPRGTMKERIFCLDCMQARQADCFLWYR